MAWIFDRGLLIACSVSYSLLRFCEKVPTKDPILKPVILSAVAVVITIVLIDVLMIFHGSSDALYASSSARYLAQQGFSHLGFYPLFGQKADRLRVKSIIMFSFVQHPETDESLCLAIDF